MITYYINRYGQGIDETVDEFDNREDAEQALIEYTLSDPSATYTISRHAREGWDE